VGLFSSLVRLSFPRPPSLSAVSVSPLFTPLPRLPTPLSFTGRLITDRGRSLSTGKAHVRRGTIVSVFNHHGYFHDPSPIPHIQNIITWYTYHVPQLSRFCRIRNDNPSPFFTCNQTFFLFLQWTVRVGSYRVGKDPDDDDDDDDDCLTIFMSPVFVDIDVACHFWD